MNFVLELEYKPYVPLYKRVSDALRKAILDGRMAPGEAMPSVRDLAETLKISRATILKSFDDLYSQGLTEAVPGSGTFVASKLPEDLEWSAAKTLEKVEPSFLAPIRLSSYGERLLLNDEEQTSVHVEEVNYGGSPIEMAPLAPWRQSLIKHCNQGWSSQRFELFGYLSLRASLQEYLQRTRQVRCSTDNVVLFGTKQGRLDLLARLLIEPGDCVAFEEPGYPESRHVFQSYGAKIVPIRVDQQGIVVSDIINSGEKFKLVYVTPSHQDPTGATLSLDRRRQLISWAAASDTFILEDDYDCEYRYGTSALPSLQGIDTANRVIYMGSLWKILYQACRIGYIVIPDCLKEIVHLAKLQMERSLPRPEQLALAEFINLGHLERFLRKSQSQYAVCRQRLILALTRHLKEYATLPKESSGMHTLIQFESDFDDQELLGMAQAVGLKMLSTRSYYFGPAVEGEFILHFAVPDSELFEERIRKFAQLLGKKI